MVNNNDSVSMQNVVMYTSRFHYSEIENKLKQFLDDLYKMSLKIVGPLTYSINNLPLDEMTDVTFYMPVVGYKSLTLPGYRFQSYVEIDFMVSTSVWGNFEANTEYGYKLLIEYMEEYNLEMRTPVFHVLSRNKEVPYVLLKIGVQKKENELNQIEK